MNKNYVDMTPGEQALFDKNWEKAHDEAKAYQKSILSGETKIASDNLDIESPVDTEYGHPGLPGWSTPKHGDWRIASTVFVEDGQLVVTEECIGYTEIDTYVSDAGVEVSVEYYVRVKPGYRATRLTRVYTDDIPRADREVLKNMTDR